MPNNINTPKLPPAPDDAGLRDFPEPLTGSEMDVRELDGFILNVHKMRSSELWALSNGDELRAAISLWMHAWHQIPAGSLPNIDRALMRFSEAGEDWTKIRSMALRGFVECSDGRLYHKTLCEEVKRAYQKKIEYRARTAAATDARNKKRNVPRHDERNVPRDDIIIQNVTFTKASSTSTSTYEGEDSLSPITKVNGYVYVNGVHDDDDGVPFSEEA